MVSVPLWIRLVKWPETVGASQREYSKIGQFSCWNDHFWRSVSILVTTDSMQHVAVIEEYNFYYPSFYWGNLNRFRNTPFPFLTTVQWVLLKCFQWKLICKKMLFEPPPLAYETKMLPKNQQDRQQINCSDWSPFMLQCFDRFPEIAEFTECPIHSRKIQLSFPNCSTK